MMTPGRRIGTGKRSFFIIAALCAMLLVLSPVGAAARQLTDMAGRRVTLGKVQRVWPAYPPLMYLVYALDPSLLVGWTMPLSPETARYVKAPRRDMPVIGGWFGQRQPNLENLVAIGPNCALVWDQTLAAAPGMADRLAKLNIPVVAVRIFSLSDYPDALRFVGDVLDRRQRARELGGYIERTIEEMKAFRSRIPEKNKVRVYYAIGPDGLTNDCDHMPFLDEAIDLAGGRSVHRCERRDRMPGKKIDQEQLLLYDPDVIITQDATFGSIVYKDPRYRLLRAVKDRKVYMIPKTPFNWLNYPPSFMRAIGIRWLAHTLYPSLYTGDIRKETRRFFKLFLNADLSNSEAGEILLSGKK